jgi:hypothetical protein
VLRKNSADPRSVSERENPEKFDAENRGIPLDDCVRYTYDAARASRYRRHALVNEIKPFDHVQFETHLLQVRRLADAARKVLRLDGSSVSCKP